MYSKKTTTKNTAAQQSKSALPTIPYFNLFSHVERAATIAALGKHPIAVVPAIGSSSEDGIRNVETTRALNDILKSTELLSVVPVLSTPFHTVTKETSEQDIRTARLAARNMGSIIVEVFTPTGKEMGTFLKERATTIVDFRQCVVELHKEAPSAQKVEWTNDETCLRLIELAYDRLKLTLQEVETIIHVSATIARAAYSTVIKTQHVAEAINYRSIF